MLLKNTKEGLLVLDKQKLVSIRSSEYDFIENNKIIAIHNDPKKTFLKILTLFKISAISWPYAPTF